MGSTQVWSTTYEQLYISARAATRCVVHGSGFLPTTSPTRDDETCRVDGSLHKIIGK